MDDEEIFTTYGDEELTKTEEEIQEEQQRKVAQELMDEDHKRLASKFNLDNGNTRGKRKSKVVTKKKIPIKKYSKNGKGSLRECVVIGEKPKFLYLDENKNPQLVDKIERGNNILVPADTIDTQNPLPFVFDSEQELSDYLELAKGERLDSLFLNIDSIYRKYVDVEEHYYTLLVANTIWTWVQDKFGYTHYILIEGDNGSGKNSALLVFRYLGYRVFYIVSASAANYYTKMGNVEEGQITIAEDEAGDIPEDKDKRKVFLTGYCSGGNIPKVELEGGRKSDDWLTYCQKWVAMEELPHKNMKGIVDRSFILRFVVGDPKYNIKDVIKSAGDLKYKPLYDELTKTRKILFCWRLLHYEEPILDVDINVKNRSAELTKPLIRLFQCSPIALERILDSLTKFMLERNEIKKNSFEQKLYEVIKFLKEERKERLDSGLASDDEKTLGELTFTNPTLMNMAKEIMECTETDRSGLYWSPLLGMMVSQTKITSIAKSKFKADPISKKIDGKTVRCLKFNEKYLERIKSSYDVPKEIKIIGKTETEKVTPVTPVTFPRGILPLYSNIMNTEIKAISNNLFENSNKNDEDYANKIPNSTTKETLIPPQTVTSVTSVTEEEHSAELPVETKVVSGSFKFDCYECIKQKRKTFRTNDEAVYKKHFVQKHHGKTAFPGKADLEKYGWKSRKA